MVTEEDVRMMEAALAEARQALEEGEIPIGAVVSCGGRIIGRGHNMTERLRDVTAHAEMLAITAATETLGGKYLRDCTLYVSMEPCLMCAGAIGWSQVSKLVYGASDPRRGYLSLTRTDRPILHPSTQIIGGLLADDSLSLLRTFFSLLRK
ncbi:MAG: nucleoside deaminase [Bacteroides sp.]|nr:nucleoside deaminase [Bacteroides sp.]MCM1379184.1 nucleoside deaminase [Bacteroides sp.]MCM1445167.1 nucleoside deaminase [Prevotella sp.]